MLVGRSRLVFALELHDRITGLCVVINSNSLGKNMRQIYVINNKFEVAFINFRSDHKNLHVYIELRTGERE